VQVGPQNRNHGKRGQDRHAQQTGAAFLHLFQRGVEQDQKQQRKQVRAGQPVDRRGRGREHRDRDGDQRIGLAPHQQKQGGEGDGQQQDAEHHHRLQSAERVELGEENFTQPLPREPGGPGSGKGENVARRNPAVGDNPLAGPNVPTGIAIKEQRLHSVHASEEERDGHEEGEVGQRR